MASIGTLAGDGSADPFVSYDGNRDVGVAQVIRRADLTPAERRIAEVILADYPRSALLTARELATAAAVSPPSVSRLAAKLGYSDFAALQDHLRSDLWASLESPSTRVRARVDVWPSMGEVLSAAIEQDVHNLRRTDQLAPLDLLDGLVARLAEGGGRVYVIGSKKARVLAEYLAIQLNQMRRAVELLDVSDGLPDAILDVTSTDTLIAIEPRRATTSLIQTVRQFSAAGAAVAAICDEYPAGPLARVDFPISVSVAGISAFDSYTAFMTVINALVAAVLVRLPDRAQERIDRLESLNAGYRTWHEEGRS